MFFIVCQFFRIVYVSDKFRWHCSRIKRFKYRSTVQQLAYQIGTRQFIPIVIFLFAIFYKDVRVFQIAWLIALIREIGDFAGAMANHPSTAGLIFIVVCMVLEISSFIYLGMIASGKIQNILNN